MYEDTQFNLLSHIAVFLFPVFLDLWDTGIFIFLLFQKIIVDKCALVCYNINTAQQYGHLAQLVEHPLDVRKVSGSRPLVSTRIDTLKSVWFQGVFAYIFSKQSHKKPAKRKQGGFLFVRFS